MTNNPFIEKAQKKNRTTTAHRIAERNYRILLELSNSYSDSDNPQTRERIRLRVVEARKALDDVG